MGLLRQQQPFFEDRAEAGSALAEALSAWLGRHPLVLAVPRGGIVLGERLALALDGDLDVVLVRKLRHPDEPELAVGAVGEGAEPLWDPRSAAIEGAWREEELARQRRAIADRRALYSPWRRPLPIRGRQVIVVDDGIATGATLLAALRLIKAQGPARLCVAAAVAPPESAARLADEADECVILAQPRDFGSVGDFFKDFRAVSDVEVVEALRRQARGKH